MIQYERNLSSEEILASHEQKREEMIKAFRTGRNANAVESYFWLGTFSNEELIQYILKDFLSKQKKNHRTYFKKMGLKGAVDSIVWENVSSDRASELGSLFGQYGIGEAIILLKSRKFKMDFSGKGGWKESSQNNIAIKSFLNARDVLSIPYDFKKYWHEPIVVSQMSMEYDIRKDYFAQNLYDCLHKNIKYKSSRSQVKSIIEWIQVDKFYPPEFSDKFNELKSEAESISLADMLAGRE